MIVFLAIIAICLTFIAIALTSIANILWNILQKFKKQMIMDYEELYKEALERAREELGSGCFDRGTVEYIFPELKESEDERIRKSIIELLNEVSCTFKYYDINKMLSWLEKQGKNNMGISEATKKKLEDNLNKYLEKETPESWNKFLEKQGKQKETPCDKCKKENSHHSCQDITALGRCAIEHDQKPTNKIELKYKVGDWIVNKQGEIARINQVKKDSYGIQRYYIEFTNGAKTDPMPCFVDENSHLWTIQDAKDGDVLYSKSSLTGIEFIVMSRGVNGYGHIDSYFRYNSEDGFGINIPSVFTAKAATPATKEQRDFLFQKMHEAGYEWNAEKKIIKKRLIKTHKVMSRQHHELKIKTKYFREIESGDKTFEVRYNDRNFQKYDILHLREYADGEYTNRKIDAEVTYILYDKEFCKEGYVIMAIKVINVIN